LRVLIPQQVSRRLASLKIWLDIGARLPQAAQMKRGSLSESRTSSGQRSAFKDTQWQLLRLPTSGSEPE
jgi:hypothetical protein